MISFDDNVLHPPSVFFHFLSCLAANTKLLFSKLHVFFVFPIKILTAGTQLNMYFSSKYTNLVRARKLVALCLLIGHLLQAL